MTNHDKQDIEEQDIVEEMEQEIDEIENEEGGIDEEKLQDAQNGWEPESGSLQDILARTQADFDNFKKRTQRDKNDMIFFLKSDILKKILPRLDDMDRMIHNTPDEMKTGALYEWVASMQTKLIKDLESMWVTSFTSKWENVNPEKHDVMTTVPWQTEGIVFDEFEKWYLLNDKVLRHAKVVVWAWN